MAITTSSYEKEFIFEQAMRLGAKRILEIGAFKGQTTAVLSKVAGKHGGHVSVIDPMKWASKPAHFFEWIDGLLHPFSYETTFWKNVRKTGYDNVTVFKGLSTDEHLLKSRDPLLQEFDLVFIDGEHTKDAVTADVLNWGSRVRKGGMILMHDIVARFPGVVEVFRGMGEDPRYRITWPRRGTVGMVEVREVAGTKAAAA